MIWQHCKNETVWFETSFSDIFVCNLYTYIQNWMSVCLYILYANLQFYSDLDEILYTWSSKQE
jgi:hypothetical protein